MNKTVMGLVLAGWMLGMGAGNSFAELGGDNGGSSASAMLKKGKAAFKTGKLEDAFDWFLKAAKKENPEAENMVGKCYENGIGVAISRDHPAQWYEKSAAHGWADGQNNLGSCYLHGLGVKQDPLKAITWYQRAAHKGSAAALYNMGYCYENGWGFPKDLGSAKFFYHKAARKGNPLAQSRLRQLE